MSLESTHVPNIGLRAAHKAQLLSFAVERVSVVGTPGSGKTRVAAALARSLDVPHIELDALFHLPGWTERPLEEFRAEVAELARQPGWVIDGNYGSRVQDIVWAHADTVVWLDLPRRVVMRRIVLRTLSRITRRTELWGGNRERWQSLFSRDPTRSIIAWAWTQHGPYTERYESAMTDPAWAHIRFIRLRSARDVARFLVAPTRYETA